MKSISLTQVTAFVVVVSLAAFFVSADDAFAHSIESNIVAHSEHSISTDVTDTVEETSERFTFTSLDNDKDGKLSQQEVIAGKNEWLVKAFKQIDSNADKAITEQELVDFVAKNTAATTATK